MAEETDKGPRPRGLGKRARITTFFVRTFFRFLGWIKFFRVKVINREVVPKKEAAIIASNHVSMFDILPLWTVLHRPVIAIGAEEQINRPFVRHLARLLGQIPVKRGDAESGAAARKAVMNALSWLAAFVIYPEGKTVPRGETSKFYPGVADFAIESGVMVYPVFTHGTNDVMPHKQDRVGRKWLFRDKQVTLVFGDPIHPDDYADRDDLLVAIEKAIFALEDQVK